jgi:hypothetical protein
LGLIFGRFARKYAKCKSPCSVSCGFESRWESQPPPCLPDIHATVQLPLPGTGVPEIYWAPSGCAVAGLSEGKGLAGHLGRIGQ